MFDWIKDLLGWLGLFPGDGGSPPTVNPRLSAQLQTLCASHGEGDDASCGAILDPDG